ncbi:MAG: hypothetical protein ABEK17_02670 [Candidatus Aenigmatarchaeota archaeon]
MTCYRPDYLDNAFENFNSAGSNFVDFCNDVGDGMWELSEYTSRQISQLPATLSETNTDNALVFTGIGLAIIGTGYGLKKLYDHYRD